MTALPIPGGVPPILLRTGYQGVKVVRRGEERASWQLTGTLLVMRDGQVRRKNGHSYDAICRVCGRVIPLRWHYCPDCRQRKWWVGDGRQAVKFTPDTSAWPDCLTSGKAHALLGGCSPSGLPVVMRRLGYRCVGLTGTGFRGRSRVWVRGAPNGGGA